MEEDIKRVENLIKKCDECKLKECINCEISWTDIVAVRRLVDAYKEIEEENKIFALEGSNIALKIHIDKNYISKSKIKEKIEELTQEIQFEENEKVVIWLHKQRKVLQDLLKGE